MLKEDECWVKIQLRTLREYIKDRGLNDDVMAWKRDRVLKHPEAVETAPSIEKQTKRTGEDGDN